MLYESRLTPAGGSRPMGGGRFTSDVTLPSPPRSDAPALSRRARLRPAQAAAPEGEPRRRYGPRRHYVRCTSADWPTCKFAGYRMGDSPRDAAVTKPCPRCGAPVAVSEI